MEGKKRIFKKGMSFEDSLVNGVENAYKLALPHLKAVEQFKRWCRTKQLLCPKLLNLRLRIGSVTPCEFFTDFLAVWMEVDAQYVARQWKRTRENGVEDVTKTICFESLHFVHKNVQRIGEDGSFELQSVQLRNPRRPFEMQCVAGVLVHFTLIIAILFHTRHTYHANDIRSLNLPVGALVVLGMGGNIITNCLAAAMPERDVIVVEIEPAVVSICQKHNAFPEKSVKVVVADVFEALDQLPGDCAFIFLDCFDPIAVSMLHAEELLKKCQSHLCNGGVLAVNAHIALNSSSLAPFVSVFGSNAVHAVNVPGCTQAMLACVHSTEIAQISAIKYPFSVRRATLVVSVVNESREQWLHGLELDASVVQQSKSCELPRDSALAGSVARIWKGDKDTPRPRVE